MISKWEHTDIPPGVDLSVPLMPLRDESDMAIYGVDEAWLNEVLSVWSGMTGKEEMPRGPAADFTNHIRFLAWSVKDATGRFYAEIPSAASATIPTAITFGDIPAYVSKGDPVRRADVADMFAWMDGAKYVKPYAVADYAIPEMTNAQYSSEGALDPTLPANIWVQNTFYEWAWTFIRYWDDGDYGGKFRVRNTPDFTASFQVANKSKDHYSGAHVFALVNGAVYAPHKASAPADGIIARGSVYVPCATTAITQSGTGVTFSATFPVSSALSALMSDAGMPGRVSYKDPDYIIRRELPDSQLTTGVYLWAAGLSQFVAFLELSPDYRHPST